ncbi:MAG TPA: 4-(cytidine 5'-diphospho)-2-C-methyl-D-erythritol kinase [Planctomycetaceae bacterium]|nr:4-(cytidine 5'-diphospho)-2-C-methyl-D-erythritol kinase [Planctomycetaceae bacterium]
MLFRQSGRSLVVQTPAKLNLFLEVLGKRPDGYHELETLMAAVGWYDTLRLTEADSDRVEFRVRLAGRWHSAAGSGDVPGGEDNLVLRAARLLQGETGVRRGARLELWKRIPPASGLAGGSSDAAAALAGLNRVWRLGLSREALVELAARLGSDVPFFLAGSPVVICRGRGERLEPLAVPANVWFVIGRPASGLSTAEVYRHCRPAEHPRTVVRFAESLQRGRLAESAAALHNALEAPATRLNTEVATLTHWFRRQPVAGHQMSGSGTACFAVCRTCRQARRTAVRLAATGLATAVAVRIAA